MKKRFRVLAAMSTILLAFGLVFGLSGCSGESEEQVVQGVVDAELDKVKSLDEDELKEYLGSAADELESYGVKPADFYSAFFGRFDYKDNGVTIDGDTATVKLTVTNVDVDKAASAFKEQATEWMTSDDAADLYTSDGEDAIYKKVFEMMMDCFNNADTKTADVELTATKDSDGNWTIGDDDETVNALFAGSDVESAFDMSDLS